MSEDDSVKHEGKWTRHDLPSAVDVHGPVRTSDGIEAAAFYAVDETLNKVADHLNAHYPRPGGSFAVMLEDTHRAQRERDEAVARADQLRDERDDAVQSCIAVGRERDAAVARAEALEAEAEEAFEQGATWHKEQSVPAVSRAEQLEKNLAKVMSDYQDLEDEREEIADQFATFRAEIVAEAVKARESAVSRAAAFDAWLAKVKADAWDEGYKDCFLSIDGSGWRELEDNPYRESVDRAEGDGRADQ